MRMTTMGAFAALATALALAACDPANSLSNQEYRAYLEGYERWEVTDVVALFNELDRHRDEFGCPEEVHAAKGAAWREAPGPVKLDQTPEGKALETCLQRWSGTIGYKQSPLAGSVLQHWVNHNVLPEAQKALDQTIAADQRRLGERGCGGDQCELLVVVGDLAVPRIGQEVSVAHDDAVQACDRADFGGLPSWRLPTKAELVEVRQSGKVATDQDLATYWSSSREIDEAGQLHAWVLRFDLASAGEQVQPKLVPFERDGVPSIAKVRCVTDLGSRPEPEGEVAEMERTLRKAGCPRGWSEYVRLRGDRVVGWKVLPARGRELAGACKGLSWCGLTWRAPSKTEAKALADDPWFRASPEGRCVADLPAAAR